MRRLHGFGGLGGRWVLALAAGVLLLTPRLALAQAPNVITTVAGGGPNNIPALDAPLSEAGRLVRDSAGNIYLAGNRRILKYDAATQKIVVFAGTGFAGDTGDGGPAAQATFRDGLTLALDPTETLLYIGDTTSHVVRRVDLATGIISTYAGNGSSPLLDTIDALAVDANGNLYIADGGKCMIHVFASGALSAAAGSGVCRGSIDGQGGNTADDYREDIPAASASLHSQLLDMEIDRFNNVLYFVELFRVRRVDLNTGIISAFAGNGTARWTVDGQGGNPADDLSDGVPATSAAISAASYIGLDPVSNVLLISDVAVAIMTTGEVDARVRRVESGFIITVVGGGTTPPAGVPPLVPPLAARFVDVGDVTGSPSGDIYLLGVATEANQIFRATSASVDPIAGSANRSCGDGQLAVDACVPGPVSVMVDAAVNTAILESSAAPIRRVDGTTGIIGTLSAPGSFPGQPADFVRAARGFFITSSSTNQILFQDSGGAVTASYGLATSQPGDPLGDDGDAAAATFQEPRGLALDAQGNLFVADSRNGRIRRIDALTQMITTVAGDGSRCVFEDPNDPDHGTINDPRDGNPATSACLDVPWRLAFDVNGDLLVTDFDGHRLRRIAAGADGFVTGAPDEIISTIAGTGVAGYSADGSPAAQAQINQPTGLAVDPNGNIYFSDTGNRVIRRIDASTQTLATVAGATGTGASEHITFASDPSWTALDSASNIVGSAQNVCLNSFNCPSGATQYGYGSGSSWPASLVSIPGATWIWGPGVTGATTPAELARFSFTNSFFLIGTPSSASIAVAADDFAAVIVNGMQVGTVGSTTDISLAAAANAALTTFDILRYLVPGTNTITIVGQNGAGAFGGCTNCTYSQHPAGVVFGGTLSSTGATNAGPLQLSLESPQGLAIGQEAGQYYLYFADTGLNRVLRLPIPVVVAPPATPSMSISGAQADEGDSGAVQLTFTVTLSTPSANSISVDFSTSDGTATTADNDYTAASGTLTFLPGETSKTIAVDVNGDATFEPDETMVVNLRNPFGATLTTAQAIGTITNDDSNTVIINVTENITVTDAPGVLPSAMLSVAESITVTDTPALLPSAMLFVSENVTVTDTATPLPSAMLTVAENITVLDTPQVHNTARGLDVSVTPIDPGTGTSPVTVTFGNVTEPGNTTLVIGPAGPPPPPGFVPGSPSFYYDVGTTAVFTGAAQVCVSYAGIAFRGTPSLWHFENGAWVDITTSVDTVNLVVCGVTTSLSPFALFEPTSLDLQAPSITLTSPAENATYVLGQSVNAAYSCSDGGSGVSSCLGPVTNGSAIDTTSVGAKSFTVTATDGAGNTVALTRQYRVVYNFVGFLQPVDNPPVINAVNAGRTVPVKWQLLNAGGAYLSDLNSFTSIVSTPIACDASPSAALEEQLTIAGDTAVRYDPAAHQFIFNWKTTTGWSGCRALQLRLADGTVHTAKFRFR